MAAVTPLKNDKPAVAQREAALAARNGTKLALSMAVTLSVAFVVRFGLPRFLGPEAFGQLTFAEAFATAFFVLTGFGFDTYIGKEVANRPDHAREFFGGMLLMRGVGAAAVCTIMAVVLQVMGRGDAWRLVGLFAGWQLLFVFNQSLVALLNARGTVNEVALTNSAGKILWGGGIMAAVFLGAPLEGVAAAYGAVEGLKTAVLWRTVRRRYTLPLEWHGDVLKSVLKTTLPFFLTVVVSRIYDKVDVNMIAAMGWTAEVGWYGAAANVAGATLLFVPLLNSVVLPMCSRIAHEDSLDGMHRVMRLAMRLVLVVSGMIALQMVLHATEIVELLFSDKYLPSIRTLQALAPTFPLTYICVLASMQLFQMGRQWHATRVSMVGLVLNVLLNSWLIPRGHDLWGDGGAGWGAACASVLTEAVTTVLLLSGLGRAAVDGLFLKHVGKLVGLLACVYGLHIALPGSWGLWRVFPEGAAYLAGVVALGLLPPGLGTALRKRLRR